MNKSSIIIAVVFLFTGFISAYFIFGTPAENRQFQDSKSATNLQYPDKTSDAENPEVVSPFVIKTTTVQSKNNDDRLASLESEIGSMKNQLKQIERTLDFLSNTAVSDDNRVSTFMLPGKRNTTKHSPSLPERLYSLENLTNGGIDPVTAENIVRRRNNVELKRLELQDRATRENYRNTQKYFDELEKIEQQDIDLREELGEQRYDEYLYSSKQSNRVMITSVMLGSSAEMVGIQKGDIIQRYDNKKMLSWQELKNATTEGELGDYVSISVLRKGQMLSYSVPRGPLGVQLGSARIRP